MIENRSKNTLCITIYRSNEFLYRKICFLLRINRKWIIFENKKIIPRKVLTALEGLHVPAAPLRTDWTGFQLNKAYTSDKETSFFELNIKVIGSAVRACEPAFTINAMTLDFLSLISPGWELMFLDSHHTVFIFLSLLDLLGVVLAGLISI